MATATKEQPAEPQATDATEPDAATAGVIADLLPQPHCTLDDLAAELDLSKADRKAIDDSQNVPRMTAREGYRTATVAREIVALGLEWKRTKLSHDRERYTLVELINPRTIYPGHQIEEMTGVSHANLCNSLGVTNLSDVSGNDLIHALRSCQSQGVRVFFSAAFIRRAVKENREELVSPPVPPSNPVDAAIAQRRSRELQNRAADDVVMLAEYGHLVQLRGNLDESQSTALGELAIELGFDGGQYARDLMILEEAEALELIGFDEVRGAEEALQDAIAKRKKLERLSRELPEKITAAGRTTQRAREHVAKCKGAPNRITELRTQHPYLFTDSSSKATK